VVGTKLKNNYIQLEYMSYVYRCNDFVFTLYRGYSNTDLIKFTYKTHLVVSFNSFGIETEVVLH